MKSSTITSSERAVDRVYAIRVEKENLKFSCAHFLIFEDGTAERLHGHNYRVAVELEAAKLEHGVIVDFNVVKQQLKSLLDRLDEHFLIPGRNQLLTWEEADGEITVRFDRRRYVVPVDEVVVLPITNTSSEELAAYISNELLHGLRDASPETRWSRIEVSVEETSGQRGLCILRP